MNKAQKIIVTTAAIGIVIMILFPPMRYTLYVHDTGEITVFGGYNFIGRLESDRDDGLASYYNDDLFPYGSVYAIEPVRLSFQLVGVLLVTGMLVVVYHDKNNN